nr:ATP-binding protein [uncultured Carboxylicivirga sp.]
MDWKRLFFRNKKHNNLLETFKKVEPVIYDIFSPSNRHIGDDYFRYIGQKICGLISADYLMIGTYQNKQNSIESLVYCSSTDFYDNIVYQMNDTPCVNVVGKNTHTITNCAWEQFARNTPLSENLVEGYIGIPLFNSSDEPIGIIVALFKDPIIQDYKTIESLMYLFTPRLSTEIIHLQAKEEVRKRNAELELMHRALKDKNKKLDYSVAELRKAQLKSKEYDQLKSTFLANLSHEIRTPLNVILGFMELLRSDSLTVEERDEYVDIVNLNGLQLLKVMDDLIDISKLQTRLMQEEYSKVVLNDLMEHTHTYFAKQASVIKKNVNINFENGLKDGMDVIISDQEALSKVMKHLLDNALKFTNEGGEISIGYEVQDDQLMFFVKDSGIGVQPGQDEIIFDMFRQGSESFKREFGGNGLGLAISKKYVETLGGQIWLDKQYKKGACFRFTIPFELSQINNATFNLKRQPLVNQYL